MLRIEQVELIERVAGRFRALSDTTRLRMLLVLKEGPRNVGQLTEALGIAQAGVSKHLGVLKGAGLVECQRVGNQAIYRIADERVFDMCAVVCDGLFKQLKSEQVLIEELAGTAKARKNRSGA